MLSKYVRKDDCGCGGGKYNCISKNTFARLLQAELKKLDCGCGCKGVKGFKKKYGGSVLKPCPPGFRNDGLTCLEECKPGEVDDGLFCRDTNPPGPGWVNDGLTFRNANCKPGWINDGLTCRKPIQEHRDNCPAGWVTDLETCRKPIVTHLDGCPAGFRTDPLTCFRDARCWQTGDPRKPVWDSGHQRTHCEGAEARSRNPRTEGGDVISRNLRFSGGEVEGHEIRPHPTRGKRIEGRLDFDALMKEIDKGITDLFEGRIDLAAAFDPERNGVAGAFRKFGEDIKKVMEDVEKRIKEGFEKMGAEVKKAFEDFARDAETKFKQFGDDFVNKMKDPDFWVEAIGIMAMVAAAAVSALITVGTLGAGSPLAIGLMAAASMAGPAAKMIASAARGEPIDALDIAQLAIGAATALVPGMSATIGPMVKTGLQAASFCITATQVGQSLGIVPSTCIANCPPDPDPADPPPINPELPPIDPPPPGQKTDEEIMAIQLRDFPNTVRYRAGKNPDYISTADFIKEYRVRHYGPNAVPETEAAEPDGAMVSAEDKEIQNEAEVTVETEPIYIQTEQILDVPQLEMLEPLPEIEDIGPLPEIGPLPDFGTLPDIGPLPDFGTLPEIGPLPEIGDIGPLPEIGAGKKNRKKHGSQLGPRTKSGFVKFLKNNL